MDNDTAAALAITKVTDSTDNPLGNPGTTSDPNLTLSGTGTENSVLILNDNGTPIGSASVKGDGTWQMSVNKLEEREHGFSVKLSGGVESAAWVITVGAAAVKPAITRVEDSKGVPVPPGGSTFDSSVTVSGTAEEGATVEIHDGTSSWGTASALGGNWTKTLSGLSARTYIITAKELSSGERSDPWGFDVEMATIPTIVTVRDSKGEIPADGSTFDTTVTLIGKAAANEGVLILDGSVSQGEALVDASGDWTHQLFGLSVAKHIIKARGLYDSGPESADRDFTVVSAVAPMITSVRDSKGEVPMYGKTEDSYVTVFGTAPVGEQIEIWVTGPYVEPPVNLTPIGGNWSFQCHMSLTNTSYHVRAVGLYGDNPRSEPRSFHWLPPSVD